MRVLNNIERKHIFYHDLVDTVPDHLIRRIFKLLTAIVLDSLTYVN